MGYIFVGIFIIMLFGLQIVSSILSSKAAKQGDENLSNTFLINSNLCMVGVIILSALTMLIK